MWIDPVDKSGGSRCADKWGDNVRFRSYIPVVEIG